MGDVKWVAFKVPRGLVLARDGKNLPHAMLQVLGTVWAPNLAEAYNAAGRTWPGIEMTVQSFVSYMIDLEEARSAPRPQMLA